MVYLVDDDIEDLEIMQQALADYSYTGAINTALNGKKLMEALTHSQSSNKPDVIVLDLNMPLKDGFQALAEIKMNPSLKSIPVIIVTASSKKEDQVLFYKTQSYR
jgi:two-component system, chemotaxis family, response regulator Rcp1